MIPPRAWAPFLRVDGDQPLARGLVPELRGAARGEHDGPPLRLAPARHAIGKRRQDRHAQGVVAARAAAVSAAAELAARAVDLLDRAAVELEPPEHVGAKARLGRLLEQIDDVEHVGAAIGWRARRAAAERGARGLPDVALGDQRRGQARGRGRAARLALDDEAREPRVDREARHAPADIGQASRRIDRAQPPEQLARAPQAAAGGGSSQASASAIAHAERREHQRQLRQIGARDLGLGLARPLFEVVAGVEAQRASGARAAGAAGALGGRRLADARERERRQAGPRASAPPCAPGRSRSPR